MSGEVRFGLAGVLGGGLGVLGFGRGGGVSTKSGVLFPRLRLYHIDTFSGVDRKSTESRTRVLGLALVTPVVTAKVGERLGGSTLGWWFVAADLVILLLLRPTEVPELEPRICTGTFPG